MNQKVMMKEKIKAKPKKPYVKTEAREQALKTNFEKARLKRMENIALKKREKEEQDAKNKEELETKLLKKASKIKKNNDKKKKVLDDIVSDDDDEPQDIIVKKKKKPRVIYLEESEEDEPIVARKRAVKTKIEHEPVRQIIKPQRMIQFFCRWWFCCNFFSLNYNFFHWF